MIKSVHIEDSRDGLTHVHIDCDVKQSGIQSIDVVCEPGKAKEAQDLVFKAMQILSLPEKVTRAAENIGVLFNKR